MSHLGIVRNCVDWLDSNEATKRKNGMKQLRDLLNDQTIVQELNNSTNSSDVNWTRIFSSAHNLLIKESEKIKSEERKGVQSSAAVWRRNSLKNDYSSLVVIIVNKANQGIPRIKCSILVTSILQVLSDSYLRKNYSDKYTEMVRSNLLPCQEYRSKLGEDHWTDLSAVFWRLFKDPPQQLEMSAIVDVLNGIVKFGCAQSFIGLKLKKKFSVLAEAFLDDNFLKASIGTQEAFLRLATSMCLEIGKECRMAVCDLGEKIVPRVLHLYDKLSKQKNLVVEFLLLQVRLHHPAGASRTDILGAAYAANWDLWLSHLRSMFALVDSELSYTHAKKQKVTVISSTFLQLAVEVCKQVFYENSKANFNQSVNLDEPTCSPVLKKRRIVGGLKDIVSNISSVNTSKECWPWLTFLTEYISRYCETVMSEDYVCLLTAVTDQLNSCRDTLLMACLCRCCSSLLRVDKRLRQEFLNDGVVDKLWKNVLDVVLRMIGLNQNEQESHYLLQEMISYDKVPSSLLDVLELYVKGTIRRSNAALKTLLVICNRIRLPEKIIVGRRPHTVRNSLVTWLLPEHKEMEGFSPSLLANVLALICFKPSAESVKCDPRSDQDTSFVDELSQIEENYRITSFECSIYKPDEIPREGCSYSTTSSFRASVDEDALKTLEDALERNCQLLLEDLVSVSEEDRPKQITNTFGYLELLLELWSWMIEFNAIPVDEAPSFVGKIQILIEKLNDNCTKEIFCREPSVATIFMQNLSHVMDLKHHQAVHKEMRCIIPNNFLTVVYSILTTRNLRRMANHDEDNDVRDEFDVESTVKRSVQSNGSISLFDTETFSETEKLQLYCVKVLSSYCCFPDGRILSEYQENCLSKLLSLFVSDIGVNTAATFYMAVTAMQKVLQMKSLERRHVAQCLRVLQFMCRSFHHDYEAATSIMNLLRGLLTFVQDFGEPADKENTVVLLKGLQVLVSKKQYGAKVVAQYIRCLGELAKVDSNTSWSFWSMGTKLPAAIVRDTTPIAEEILVYIQHPFHELRMVAIMFIPTLFDCFEEEDTPKLQWHSNLFESLCKMIMEAFVVEGELSEHERVDESANRTSTALHSVAALLVSNSILRKKSLFFLLQLIKEKNISLDLVKKSLNVAGNAMKIIGSKLIAANLKYLFTHWCLNKYRIQDFPWPLLECSSEADFYTTHLKTVVPILFFNRELDAIEELCLKVGKDLKLVTEICCPYIIGHLLPIIIMKNNKELYNTNMLNAEQLLKQLEKILSEYQVKCLLSENMDIVIVTIFRLLFDVDTLTNLCGYRSKLPDPAPPTIKSLQMLDTLEYLQKNSQAPEVKLMLFLAKNKPRVIQKILLQLAVDIHEQLTCEEMIISLHRYAVFVDLLGCNLTDNSLNAMSPFAIREITHQLINIVRQGYQQNQGVLAIAACNCLLHFLVKCLPVKAKIVQKFLGMCTSVLVPVVKSGGNVCPEACKLLKFIIVQNAECLSSAIRLLGPFPALPSFDEIQKVYEQIVYGEKQYTLEEEIKYFLEAETYCSCHVERLKHLYFQLSTRKAELKNLYLSLNQLRGFSEDCEESILHQLLCVLVGLTSAEDKEVQLEASRCLGEIGPSDLTTLVLQPEKETGEIIVLSEDIIVLLMGSVLKKLSVALVDENISVIKETSSALYTILASKEARKFLESGASKFLNQDYIMPFINHKKMRHDISLDVDTELFRKLVDCHDTWTPRRCTHDKWITDLVCSILQTFDADKNFLPHLIPVCRVKVSLCEEMLPYLLDLILAGKEKVCSSIVIRHLQHFFKEHFRNHLESVRKLNTLLEMSIDRPEYKLQVIMNRASVQCMLDAVHFLRMRRHVQQRTSDLVTELDFLHISLAAQFCSAYFTSILYAELWCHEKLGSQMDTDKMSLLESICQNDKENGQILQHILWEAYTKIGDSDAVYGCWPSNMLDNQSCIQHLKLKAKWDRVLQAHDLELCCGNSETVPGLLNALQNFGLHHVMDGYLCSSFVREHLPVQKMQNYYYDCAWRLANWNTDMYFPDAPAECFHVEKDIQKELYSGTYEKYHYLAMNAIQNLDEDVFKKNLRHARSCVVESLAHASLETSKFLYTALSQLRALQEMEDFFQVISINDSKKVDDLLKKWNQQDLIQYNDFDNVEPILTQRIVMLKTTERKELVNPHFQKVIVNLSLDIAALARNEKHFQVAARYIRTLSTAGSLPVESAANLKVEEARLLWDRDDKELALCILKGLLSKPENSKGKWHALSLKLYGDWMVETKSENAEVIINDYFLKALKTLESCGDEITDTKIETYWSVACFADSQYQQLSCYFKSAEYEVKRKYLDKALHDVERLKQQAREGGTLNEDEKRTYRMHERQTQIDRAEIANRRKEMDMYLTTAIRYYIMGLECDDTHDLQVFRVAHLWLENTLHNDLNAVLDETLFRVPSYKFLPLLPQLIPHMSHTEDNFSRKINMLIEQCAVEHPHHSLQQILALANSHKDKEVCGVNMKSVIYEPRVIGAQQMVERLKKSSSHIAPLLQQMEKVAAALISFAYCSPKENSKTVAGQIPRGELLSKLKNLDIVLVPTLTIPVKPNRQYSNIIGIAGFEKTYQMVGGVNAPKKIVCIGTDGVKRPQLVKGRDDLRQDAVMQQVFIMMNTFLRRNKETSKRKLLMRTYKVVPLSQRSGIIEWCDNTEVLAIYLIGSDLKSGAHKRYYPSDLPGVVCRKKMKDVASESNERKLEVYKEICKSFRPVLHNFFLEYFPAPSIWFERRLAYIHSVATSSMIGYILGLGDRHVNNILIDKMTAEVIHIDFGIAFEMGRILPTPETVPFRLTRDIVDGMGVSGVEGVFRRCCEKTMTVLRQNQETILTILEVLLYDPLYSWSVTPKKAYNLQSNSGSLGNETEAGEETSNEVNKMAERALLRLRQKLHGTEEGTASSVAGQVNHLIQQATDPVNLSRLFNGWQPYL